MTQTAQSCRSEEVDASEFQRRITHAVRTEAVKTRHTSSQHATEARELAKSSARRRRYPIPGPRNRRQGIDSDRRTTINEIFFD
jgi:hypothetical protein